MPRFFTNEIDENNIVLIGDDANHIGRSLRMRVGEDVTVCCNGVDYCCKIGSITSDAVYLDLVEKHRIEKVVLGETGDVSSSEGLIKDFEDKVSGRAEVVIVPSEAGN